MQTCRLRRTVPSSSSSSCTSTSKEMEIAAQKKLDERKQQDQKYFPTFKVEQLLRYSPLDSAKR